MTKCDECGQVVVLETELGTHSTSEANEKILSHRLWHHPSESEIKKTFDEIQLASMRSSDYFSEGNYLEASFALRNLIETSLRARRYMENKMLEG